MYRSTNFEYNRKLDQYPKAKQKGAGHQVSLCKVHILFFHLVKEKKEKQNKILTLNSINFSLVQQVLLIAAKKAVVNFTELAL